VPQVAMLAQRRAMPEQRRPLLAQLVMLVMQALLMRRRVSQQPDLAVLPVCTCAGELGGVLHACHHGALLGKQYASAGCVELQVGSKQGIGVLLLHEPAVVHSTPVWCGC
jgi:hypothetical protein